MGKSTNLANLLNTSGKISSEDLSSNLSFDNATLATADFLGPGFNTTNTFVTYGSASVNGPTSNVVTNTTSVALKSSTTNTVLTSTYLSFANTSLANAISIANSTSNTIISSSVLSISNSTVNTTINLSGISIGNSTVNTTANSTNLRLSAQTVPSTSVAGTIEYDGKVFYMSPATNARGVIPTQQIIVSNATFTLTSSTSLQKLFGFTGGPAAGALNVETGVTYMFESQFSLSSMSATSGNFGFSVLGSGNATIGSAAWQSVGFDSTTLSTAGAFGGVFSSANGVTGNILVAGTGTAAAVNVKGIIRVTTGGTIIPSIQLTTAAAAVVGINSWFQVNPIGTNTFGYVGNWS